MKTMTKIPKTGMEISFNKEAYQRTVQLSKPVLVAIEKVIHEYALLGLVDFDENVLRDLLIKGLQSTTAKLVKQIEQDLTGFSNRLTLKETLGSLDKFLQPLSNAVDLLKQSIKFANSQSQYHLNLTDFELVRGIPMLKEEPVKHFFTKKILNENQAEVYSKLLSVVKSYNETVDILKSHGFQFKNGQNLLNTFLKIKPEGTSSIGFPIGDKIEIDNENILLIK